MTRHKLDPYPNPKDKIPLCINDPWLIDEYIREFGPYELEQ